jgi:hypothetical protein
MTEQRPARWPVDEPVDLDALGREHGTPQGELYVKRADEKALHEMVLDSIRHDLEQQPSPVCVFTAARNWCTRITAEAERVARAKRSTA